MALSRPILASGLLLLSLVLPAFAQSNLVFNGDFEQSGDAAPPAGWAMWGPEASKILADYPLDRDHPHAGHASLKIVYPRGTQGYIVQSPANAIRPAAGKTYDFTFFARADKPGRSVFGITAYSKTDPFVDAPSPGFWTIDLTTDWQPFHFTIHDGVDFTAATSPLLMLTFKATTDTDADRTIWIDDVSAVASPNPANLPKLVDESMLAYTPIDHGLTPGDTLAVTVDTAKPLGDASPLAMGVSFHRIVGWTQMPYDYDGHYTLPKQLERAIADLHLPMTRFYAVGDEKLGAEWAIDRIAEICTAAYIPQDRVILELEDQYANTTLPPDAWARAVRHSIDKHYGFHDWEIGNEVYSSLFGGAKAFPDADIYLAHFKAVSKAIRAVQPTARIGVSIDPDVRKWGSYVLAGTAGSYDFVVPHFYAGGDAFRQPFEDLVLGLNYRTLDRAAKLNALIAAYNPGRHVTILDSEWGTYFNTKDDRDPDYENRNANVIDICHRAVRMIYYTRLHLVEGASGWQMLSNKVAPGFGVLIADAPDRRTMLYWLYYHCTRQLGERLLPITGTAPYFKSADPKSTGPQTPLLVTASADGKTVKAIAVNGSWTQPAPITLTLQHFQPSHVDAIALSQDDLDANAILPDAADPTKPVPVEIQADRLTATLPPHSVVFLTAVQP